MDYPDRWSHARGHLAAVRRFTAVAVLAGVLVVLLSAPAQAHPPGVQPAVDYRTRVTGIEPAVAGVSARYVADGSRLELRNDSGRTIEVLGYQGEPMFQVRPNGVWQNVRSPSLYVDNLGIPVNPAADAHAAPQWQPISTRPLLRWQDHRALWHGNPPPQVRADPSQVHRVSDWRVPLHDGAATIAIVGTLDWVPPPDPGVWWAATLLLAAAVAALGLTATAGRWPQRVSRRGLAGVAVAVGGAAAGYPLLVAANNAPPGVRSLALALLRQALPVAIGLGVIAAGVAVFARRPGSDFGLALSAACAALFVGAANAAVFYHGVAPIPADGRWAGLAVAGVLGGGIGLATAGILQMRRSTSAAREDPGPAW